MRYFGIITLQVESYSWTYEADITSSLRGRDLYVWFRDQAMSEAKKEFPFRHQGSSVTLFYFMEEVTNDQS